MNLRRHTWLGLCLAVVLGMSGCSAVPVATPAPQVQPTAAVVALDVTAHDGLSLARIRHHDFEQQVNAQLSDYLQPLIDALQPALQDGSVELNYNLQAASGGHESPASRDLRSPPATASTGPSQSLRIPLQVTSAGPPVRRNRSDAR